MANIRSLKLDLVRSGPAHNQLLSPLTPYLALCGAEGPVTVHVPFEHAQLLTRLERLRYSTEGIEIAPAQREAEVHELGRAIGDVLGHVPGLLSEVSRARSDLGDLIHLRLSMTAYELALMPFELAIAPDGFPGPGDPLLLQSIAPTVLTREFRRGHTLPVHWNRPFKILFAFAAPGDLPPVPAQAHLEALRRAIEPWTPWARDADGRIEAVKKILTVLPNASLQQIRRACEENEYTHVHILAHGELDAKTGRYVLVLCGSGDPSEKDLVEGGALGVALTARGSADGVLKRSPTVVSLATCDSGNAGSVVTAGGSLAHALHAAGIPWVFASQFPLWMRASSIAVEALYEGLLRADDPRWVLHALRQRLRVDASATHDWASIVAYAEIPADFERQVAAFCDRQTRLRIEVKFDKAQKLAGRPAEQDSVYAAIRHDVTRWLAALPADTPRRERSELLGMRATVEKRIGNLMHGSEGAKKAYGEARSFYERALRADSSNHWVITQFLSMTAVIANEGERARLPDEYGAWWVTVRQIANWQLQKATGDDKAWAFGTLAELNLLGTVYVRSFDAARARGEIEAWCRELCDVVGEDGFPVRSTRRQFMRYLVTWPVDAWEDLAKAAIQALPEGADWVNRAYQNPNVID